MTANNFANSHRINPGLRKPFVLISLLMAIFGSIASAQDATDMKELPLFELEDYEVIYSDTGFNPLFRYETPQFSYYDVPELPRGDLILALEFMDRYNQSIVPGPHKWAGLLNFPVIDGYERRYIKWLCLYMYNNVMYGYDPVAEKEADRRFVVPIRYEDRTKSTVLYQFAESYVETIFPEEEEYYYDFQDFSGGEEDGFTEETLEFITIPAGRIAPVLSSQRDRDQKDLVRLVYQAYVDPNPHQDAELAMGPGENFGKTKYEFTWANVMKELGGYTVDEHVQLAKALVAPRWSQKVIFHYRKGILLWNLKNQASILLFNVGNRLFAYSPRFGVWKTEAFVTHLNDQALLETKLKYPGIKDVERIEFVPNETGPYVGQPK
ncbi:MAG: hypothetical protein AB3N63_01505 [Puniceicoccaceae bacterium]